MIYRLDHVTHHRSIGVARDVMSIEAASILIDYLSFRHRSLDSVGGI